MRQRRTEKEWAEILQKKLSDTPLEVISIDGLLPDSLCTVHCKVCNATYTVRRDCLTHYRNCSVCNNKRVIQGINDLYTTDKWMIPYLANPDDAYKYTKASPKKIMLKCPECGNKKIGCLNNLYHRGYRCTYCARKLSKMLGRKCNSTNIKKGIVKNSVRYGFTYKTYKMVHNIA